MKAYFILQNLRTIHVVQRFLICDGLHRVVRISTLPLRRLLRYSGIGYTTGRPIGFCLGRQFGLAFGRMTRSTILAYGLEPVYHIDAQDSQP